jgi:hypothetical protein
MYRANEYYIYFIYLLESNFFKVNFKKINFRKINYFSMFGSVIENKAMFVFWNSLYGKSLSKFSCVCLSLGKLVNRKHFPVKVKFDLVSRKVFSWRIWAENTFWKLWKFKNIILFADYIKFDPQSFDCYI